MCISILLACMQLLPACTGKRPEEGIESPATGVNCCVGAGD